MNRPTSRLMVASLSLLAACQLPQQAHSPVQVDARDCPRLAHFDDEASLLAALPELYAEHHRDLIVISGSVYLSACSSQHLGGASETSRLGSAAEQSRLGSEAESSRLASAGENSRLGSDGEDSRLGGAGEDSRLGSAGEDSRLGGAGENSRLGSDGENSRVAGIGEQSRVGSEGEASRLGSAGEDSRLGSAGESSRLGGNATRLTCSCARNELGYTLSTPAGRDVRIYDGVSLWRLVDGRLVDEAE